MADDQQSPLTEDEIARIRTILQQEQHMIWFWATARRIAVWTFGATAILVAFREDVRSIFHWFVRGP